MSNGMRMRATPQQVAEMRMRQMQEQQGQQERPRPPRVPAWNGQMVGVYLNGVIKVDDETVLVSLLTTVKQPDDGLESVDVQMYAKLEIVEKAVLIGRRVAVGIKAGWVETIEECS